VYWVDARILDQYRPPAKPAGQDAFDGLTPGKFGAVVAGSWSRSFGAGLSLFLVCKSEQNAPLVDP
jgi:hypothetical protein